MLHNPYLYNLNCINYQNCILFLSDLTNLSDLLIVKNPSTSALVWHKFLICRGNWKSKKKDQKQNLLGFPLSARTVNFRYSWILTSSSVVMQRKLSCEYKNQSLQFFDQWDDDENEDIFDW